MKERTKKIFRDPLFIQLCLLIVAMVSLAAAAILMFKKPAFSYVLQGVYVFYAVILFFFVKTLIKLYLKYFRQKKANKGSLIKNRIKSFFRSADEKLRKFFNLKPRGAFFGGDDTSYSEKSRYSGRKKREKGADKRIKWSDLNENRQKIRYLFAARVSEGISEGARVSDADTARQIEKKISKDDRDEMLFSLYESVRYTDKNEPIDDGTVNYLSERGAAERKKKK